MELTNTATVWGRSIQRHEERDRARRTAVDLENRLAAAEAAIDRVRALHHKFGIYEECGHNHRVIDSIDDAEVIHVRDLGLVCEDGHIRDVCAECCIDDGYLRQDCADNHDGPCWPCPTLHTIEAR